MDFIFWKIERKKMKTRKQNIDVMPLCFITLFKKKKKRKTH